MSSIMRPEEVKPDTNLNPPDLLPYFINLDLCADDRCCLYQVISLDCCGETWKHIQ
jgi:hypothetical protein